MASQGCQVAIIICRYRKYGQVSVVKWHLLSVSIGTMTSKGCQVAFIILSIGNVTNQGYQVIFIILYAKKI